MSSRSQLCLSSGRVKGQFRCQVSDCNVSLKRIDLHMASKHFELTTDEQEEMIKKAKQEYIIKKLAELRASNPKIPMASFLDQISTISHNIGAPLLTSTPIEPEEPSTIPETQCSDARGEEEQDEDPHPSTSQSSSATNMPSSICTNSLCIKEKAIMRDEIKRLTDQLKCSGGECRNTSCVAKAAELQKYAAMFIASLHLKARKKFSRKDTFSKAHNPKYEKVLQQFLKFTVGCNPSSKKSENVKTAISHVRRFLIHYGEGKLLRGNFGFLKDSSSIAKWVDVLREDGFKPTTMRIQLLNIKKFFKYILHMSQKETRLSGLDFRKLFMELDARIKDLSSSVITHRQKIRKSQSHHIVPKEDTKRFRKGVRRVLPKKLKTLESNPSWEILDQVYGMLVGYFVSVSGHRKGVLQNLKVSEVMDADVEGDHVVVEVSKHKSASTYGHAQLAMNHEEYSWFTKLVSLRDFFAGGDSEHFF
ncbi:hypothetical protein AMEX_G12766 [Astyanax mexicanus]|uniref:Uncharacterized protein n=1 Tax=Astyanax mexicanus TaxID=7994 RepID=A0A8T2LQ59_ASTMX|nr:hypothetical protein AMEX_G12766 [Astyanax mexicanus]